MCEVLLECEVLLKKVLYLIYFMCFIMLYLFYLCFVWLICLGLFIYDYLVKWEILEGLEFVYFNVDSLLKDIIKCGFEYLDCIVDDVCLVVVNVI